MKLKARVVTRSKKHRRQTDHRGLEAFDSRASEHRLHKQMLLRTASKNELLVGLTLREDTSMNEARARDIEIRERRLRRGV